MHRVTLPRPLVALLVGLLLAVGLQAPSDAAISRTVSLATSATSGIMKTAMTFSGKVSKSPKGSTITIQRKVGTKWVAVKSTRTTTTAGNYSLVLTLPGTVGTYSFRSYAPATRTLRAAVSVTRAVKVLRKTTVTATADPMTMPAGGSTTLKGTVSPYVVNTLVSVQKLLNGKWTNITTAPITSGGAYSVSFTVGPTTDLRVASPLTGYNAIGYSPTRRVTTTPVIANGANLPSGTRTLPYSAKLITIGGEPGFWTATGLPNGLSLNGSTGVISGTPTQNIQSSVTVSYKRTIDGLNAPPKQLVLSVNQAPAPVITTQDADVPDGTQVAPYSATLAATGPGASGTPAGTWSVDNLPDGLTLNPATGKITGAPEVFGTFTLVLGFTQGSTGLAAQQVSFPITITQAGPPTITSSALPDGTRTLPYNQGTPVTLVAKGPPNGANVSGTWSSTTLPAGLTLNASTGAVSGTPTAVESKSITFTFTQAITGRQATKQIGVNVVEVAGPQVTTNALTSGTVNVAYNGVTPAVTTTGPADGTWSATGLPSGVSINPDTGKITGTPTAAGTFEIPLKFTQDSSGFSDTANLTLAIKPAVTTASLADGTAGSSYSVTLAAAGGPGGTWSATPRPAGIGLDTATGVLSGTPTAAGSTNVVITYTLDGQTSANKNVTLVVKPAVTPSSLAQGTAGTAYSATLTATGGSGGTWTASPLPAGLSLNEDTGAVTGTPTTAGSTTIVATYTVNGQTSANKNVTLVVKPAVTTSSLAQGTAGTAYSATLTATGGSGGTWTASPLPAGLSLNEDTGAVTGTPTTAGSTTIVATYTVNGQTSANKNVTLVVKPAVTTSSLADGTVGASYSVSLAATGGSGGTWSATPRPAGIAIDTDTGVLSGTPTAAGSTNVVITYTVNGQTSASKTLALAVKPVVTTPSLADGTVGASYSVTLAASGGSGGTWSATPRPAGIAIDTDTGVLSGTPTAAGSTNVVITYTVNGQTSASKTLSLNVKPVITTSSLTDGTVGTAYSRTLAASGGSGGTWTASPLPAGLSLNAGTGEISGTPTTAGTTSVVIGYSRGGVAATGKTLDLDIKPVINTASLPHGTRTQSYSFTLDGSGSGTWTASPLPAGLSLNPSTGAITGTPTAVGSTNVVITYTVNGVAATGKTLALVVDEAPSPVISTSSLPDGTEDAPYSTVVQAQGDPAGTWDDDDTLPAGLSIDGSDGTISGTPSVSGDFSVTIFFTQTSTGLTTSKTFSLHLEPAGP